MCRWNGVESRFLLHLFPNQCRNTSWYWRSVTVSNIVSTSPNVVTHSVELMQQLQQQQNHPILHVFSISGWQNALKCHVLLAAAAVRHLLNEESNALACTFGGLSMLVLAGRCIVAFIRPPPPAWPSDINPAGLRHDESQCWIVIKRPLDLPGWRRSGITL